MSTSIPPVEPLLAGTLALMSATRGGDVCPRMAAKIAHNMAALACHPQFSDEFRTVAARLAAQWSGPARTCTAVAAPADAVWH